MASKAPAELQLWRDERRQTGDKPLDNRTPGQRDRDRILYSSAFRRLGGVTQVVAAREEGHLFHNRLTHSLKVAQVARRLAEKLGREAVGDRGLMRTIRRYGGLDPDVTEAAGLAHDLGHPPFGHIAERELDAAIRDVGRGPEDGFEGNAQAFRILGKLAAIDETIDGLNLTRACLNAVLKYPWTSQGRTKKYGVYSTELEDFEWARHGIEIEPNERTLEAQIMDWADDIAYSVHDVEDFFRAGLIPMGTWADTRALRPIYEEITDETWDDALYGDKPSRDELDNAAGVAIFIFSPRPPFTGTRIERARLRGYTSQRIGTLVKATSIASTGLGIERAARIQVELLKQLTHHYVVRNAALATQQHGQRQVIRDLYQDYREALRSGGTAAAIFPPRTQDEVKGVSGSATDERLAARVVADVISGMTEAQAIRVHQRLRAVDFGPLLDPAVL
jgi:dGTPase